jgi:hypothetical protein
MTYRVSHENLHIDISRNGQHITHTLTGKGKDIYLSAVEKIQDVEAVRDNIGIPVEEVSALLTDMECKGMVLLSPDKKSFLSLATKA